MIIDFRRNFTLSPVTMNDIITIKNVQEYKYLSTDIDCNTIAKFAKAQECIYLLGKHKV